MPVFQYPVIFNRAADANLTLFFRENKNWAFHMNRLLDRRYARNANLIFSEK